MDEQGLEQLRSLTREHWSVVWELAQLTDKVDDMETTHLIRALKEHPEYYYIWDQLAEYGDEDIEIDGVSPIMHVNIHVIIENQLAGGEPSFVSRALRKLVNGGVDRHQAIHVIGNALAEQIYTMLSKKQPYDAAQYQRDIERYVSERLSWEAERKAKKKRAKKRAKRAKGRAQ